MLRNRMFLVAVCLMLSLWGSITVSAQENLLRDPGFEGNYTGRGRPDFNFPEAWDGWYTESPRTQDWMNVPPNAFPHSGGFKRAGQFSQSIGRGSGSITAAVFQQVPNIPAGTRLKASAWVFMENVSESNSQVRIGIGTNVGGNPTAGGITWSNWMKTVQSWQQISVEAVSAGGTVTVFIYTDQVWPNDPNALYIDETSLVATGTGEVPPDNGGDGGQTIKPLPTTAPPQNVVPFASAQGAREDGSIVHRVVSGDTIASIAVAYGVTQQEILDLNNISNARLISVGQELLIKPAPTADPDAATTEEPTDDAGDDEDASAAVDEPAATEEPAETEEPVESTMVAQEPTEAPTEAPTNIPEPTAIPSTPTTAPTAPVISESSGDVFPSGNPADGTTAVCVLMFNDANQNRVLEVGENALASGTISITGSGEPTTYVTNGESEPFCLELEPGDYTASATPPEGYGLTTPRQLVIRVETGVQFSVNFGAAEGVTMAAVPTSDAAERAALTDADAAPETSAVPSDPIRDNIGLIIFGLAGLVLIGGLGLSVVLRQR